jgi:hypothetical protein
MSIWHFLAATRRDVVFTCAACKPTMRNAPSATSSASSIMRGRRQADTPAPGCDSRVWCTSRGGCRARRDWFQKQANGRGGGRTSVASIWLLAGFFRIVNIMAILPTFRSSASCRRPAVGRYGKSGRQRSTGSGLTRTPLPVVPRHPDRYGAECASLRAPSRTQPHGPFWRS